MKIRKSTGNIAKEPAMTKEEACKAIDAGVELVGMAKNKGYQAFGTGEMGIGNTTSSSAVLAALLGLSGAEVDSVVGRGAGLSDIDYENKKRVIKDALRLHSPNQNDPVDILQKVGGLDLAALTGAYIGAAHYGLPVVIDGFISVVAALCAAGLDPAVKEYMFASHSSYERGYQSALDALGLSSCLDLEMRLGEGSGCPLMFCVMDGALEILKNMATFDEAMIDNLYVSQMGLSF
jgi:nicotinate-nucleotide--dimethylbenzimidazole phosphoribosyltransferase